MNFFVLRGQDIGVGRLHDLGGISSFFFHTIILDIASRFLFFFLFFFFGSSGVVNITMGGTVLWRFIRVGVK